jgi:hypothetical protein
MDIRDKKIKMPVWYLMEPVMKRLRQSSMPERSRSIEVEALGRDEWLNIRHVDFFGRDRHVVIRLQVHPINRGCGENAGEAQRRVRRDPISALGPLFGANGSMFCTNASIICGKASWSRPARGDARTVSRSFTGSIAPGSRRWN